MATKTTIFYENSMGIISQWSGEVIAKTDTSISIRFSKNKALKYDLNNSGFCLVTKNKLKFTSPLIQGAVMISFADQLREELKNAYKDNTAMLWNGSNFEA